MSSAGSPDSQAAPGPSKPTFSLENILGQDHESIEHPSATDEPQTAAEGWDEEAAQEHAAQGFCIECEGALCGVLCRDPTVKTDRAVRPACAGLLRILFRQLL